MMIKLITLFLLSTLIMGCALFRSEPQVPPVEFERRIQPIPVFHPPMPREINWLEVEWRVWTPELMQEYLDKIERGEAPAQVYYGVTTRTYESLSMNMADIERYLKDTRALLEYYRKNLVEIVIEENTPRERQQ